MMEIQATGGCVGLGRIGLTENHASIHRLGSISYFPGSAFTYALPLTLDTWGTISDLFGKSQFGQG